MSLSHPSKINLASTSPQEEAPNLAPPALWNPNAACLWSFLFTPIFGAWLQAKNYRILGDPRRARTSIFWAWGTVLFILVTSFTDLPNILSLVFLITWYLTIGVTQVRIVKEKYADQYERKSWIIPLSIGFVIQTLLIGLALATHPFFLP